MRPEKWFLVLSGSVALILLAVFFARPEKEREGPQTPITVTPAPSAQDQILAEAEVPNEWVPAEAAAKAPDPASVPELDVSDELVRRLLVGLSSRPELASWLVTDRLVERFVAAVQAVAGGYSPRHELAFMKTSGRFLVQRRADRLVIAPSSYGRYSVVTEVLLSCKTTDLVSLYVRLKPLIEEAHHQLPWTRSGFEDTLLEAVDHLLATPVPEEPFEVRRTTLTYAFADPELERLSDAQRQLLRMGPGNATKIQGKLRELRSVLYPEEEPPPNTHDSWPQTSRLSDYAPVAGP